MITRQVGGDVENGWVIKDDEEHFANKNSIKKSGINTWIYISYKTFSPFDCRGYTTKQAAEKVLTELNRRKTLLSMNTALHLESHNIQELIQQHKEFSGENMVIQEIKISVNQPFSNLGIANI